MGKLRIPSVRPCGVCGSLLKENVMPASRRAPLAVLGWQTWGILVAVLALMILTGMWFLNW